MAEGGRLSGNGGFVETSGHGYLEAVGYVDLLALNGQKGTYLLDPASIEIYGNVTPAFNATDSSISLSSALQLSLDASDTSKVQLTYNDLSTTATGSIGTNTITVGDASQLVIGERIQLGAQLFGAAAEPIDWRHQDARAQGLRMVGTQLRDPLPHGLAQDLLGAGRILQPLEGCEVYRLLAHLSAPPVPEPG